jgi:putative colanic acid biosynthesis acetyltransferase WcaF
VKKMNVARPVISFGDQIRRCAWSLCWMLLCRWTPRPLHRWRCFVVSCWGADVARTAHIYPTVTIWAPWNLSMEDNACLGPFVECYNVARISLRRESVVSQRSYLCSASHDYTDREFPLICAPIEIGVGSWICAGSFVGPGVVTGEWSVVAACCVLTKSIPSSCLVAGNPSRVVRNSGRAQSVPPKVKG